MHLYSFFLEHTTTGCRKDAAAWPGTKAVLCRHRGGAKQDHPCQWCQLKCQWQQLQQQQQQQQQVKHSGSTLEQKAQPKYPPHHINNHHTWKHLQPGPHFSARAPMGHGKHRGGKPAGNSF